jgi:UDP-N-acetylglucosamine 2-epimerase (non-hydrolysing)
MKVMILFGTRPEIIKLAPLVQEFEKFNKEVETVVVSTGQHREFTQQMTKFFNIQPRYDLDIMQAQQTLAYVTSSVINHLDPILIEESPDVLIVQGDTTSSTAAALAASFRSVRVAHVEAGLRTPDKFVPFPEEFNRRVTGASADWHFAPTEWARDNLLKEGKEPGSIHVTGNTVIDALNKIIGGNGLDSPLTFSKDRKELLVTLHRRESFGKAVKRVCYAIRSIVEDHEDVTVTFPVHWNPSVRKPVMEILGNHPRIDLIEPVTYVEFVNLLSRCYFVMTDSGGVQEEAPSFGKPLMVLREVTERPEAVGAGVARLVGTDPYKIMSTADQLLTDAEAYQEMVAEISPFGDGRACQRIVGILLLEQAGYRSPNYDIPEFKHPSKVQRIPLHV